MSEDWIAVIDDNGFWVGQVLDTPKTRERLREEGFEVFRSCASKQYSKGDSR